MVSTLHIFQCTPKLTRRTCVVTHHCPITVPYLSALCLYAVRSKFVDCYLFAVTILPHFLIYRRPCTLHATTQSVRPYATLYIYCIVAYIISSYSVRRASADY